MKPPQLTSGIVALLSMGVALQSCRSRQDIDQSLAAVLKDFTYVGSTVSPPEAIPKHGTDSQTLPQHYLAGHAYVFHRLNEAAETPPWQLIEQRLRSVGIEVLSAPKGAQGLMYSYVGGPFFIIRFRAHDRLGSIQSQLDGTILNDLRLSQKWKVEDYILLLEN